MPLDAIEAQGPYDMNLPVVQQEPTAEQRSSQIIGEGALYRLRFENNPALPIISVFAQAPDRGRGDRRSPTRRRRRCAPTSTGSRSSSTRPPTAGW